MQHRTAFARRQLVSTVVYTTMRDLGVSLKDALCVVRIERAQANVKRRAALEVAEALLPADFWA